MKQRAFTLIELLIAISIMAILFTIGIAKYNDFNRRQILSQATLELKSNLRLIQDKALSGEKDSSCISALEGWYISFPTDHSYKIYGQCGDTEFPIPPTTIDLLKKHIKIGLSGTLKNYVKFKPLGHGSEEEVTITLEAFGTSSQIVVTKVGEIK